MSWKGESNRHSLASMGIRTSEYPDQTPQTRQTVYFTDVKPTINTIDGEAKYVRTEIEDVNGRWNDSGLYTSSGWWVIHRGIFHHVYKV